MTLVRGRGWLARRGQASKVPTGPHSSNKDHEDSLGSNKPGSSEALTGSKAPAGLETPAGPEAPSRPTQAPLFLQDPGANRYSQQNLDKIIQTFFYAPKGRFGDKLKAKTPDVYRGKSHMECYNFCQQCEDHFATCKATGPNQILFATSFLRDRINFHWQQHKR